jgi:hypothetical protein
MSRSRLSRYVTYSPEARLPTYCPSLSLLFRAYSRIVQQCWLTTDCTMIGPGAIPVCLQAKGGEVHVGIDGPRRRFFLHRNRKDAHWPNVNFPMSLSMPNPKSHTALSPLPRTSYLCRANELSSPHLSARKGTALCSIHLSRRRKRKCPSIPSTQLVAANALVLKAELPTVLHVNACISLTPPSTRQNCITLTIAKQRRSTHLHNNGVLSMPPPRS